MKSILLIAAFVFASVQVYSQNFSTKKGGHSYTMEIPDYLTKTYELNDAASLQYQNILKGVYVTVIEDHKDQLETLGMKYVDSKDFLEDFIDDYMLDAKKRKVSNVILSESNGNKNAQLEMTWKQDEYDYYMLITVVETKTNFYKILSWTSLENKNKFKNDFLVMANSLKD